MIWEHTPLTGSASNTANTYANMKNVPLVLFLFPVLLVAAGCESAATKQQAKTEALIERLQQAMNAHDIEAFLACFTSDYQSEQPIHPGRAFRGSDQVRKNWSTILDSITDFRAELLRSAVEGDTAWGEWRWFGTRPDGSPFDLRGTITLLRRGQGA
jgi:ketosteroid isomerase-like protein